MKSRLLSKNVIINGHRTSLRLEQGMWEAIDDLCALEGLTRDGLCDLVERTHNGQNRSSALRAFVVTYFHELSTRAGREEVGHAALLEAGPGGHLEHTIRTFRGA